MDFALLSVLIGIVACWGAIGLMFILWRRDEQVRSWAMRRNGDAATAMGWKVATDDGWTDRYYDTPAGERVRGEPSVDDMLDWLRERGMSLRDALERAVVNTD